MTCNLKNRDGLSLTELLITTSIVGMMMLGIVSIDFALRSSDQQQSRASLVSLRTSAAMFEITSTASQALGSTIDRCIQIGNINTDNTNFICVYRDINSTSSTADDQWVCYTQRGNNLHRCVYPIATTPNPINCSGAATDRIIGTVTTDVYAPAADAPVVVNNRAALNFYFQITLKSRYDPTAATYAAVVPQEYLTNPKIRMTSRVSPAGCTP